MILAGQNKSLAAGDEAAMALLAGFESSVEGLGGRGAAGLIGRLPLTSVSRSVAAAVSGGSGRGGGGGGGRFCVASDSIMASGGRAGDVRPGDMIEALDESLHGLMLIEVEVVDFALESCVEIQTASGATLRLSEPTPITQPDGGAIPARAALGALAAVKDRAGLRWESIVSVCSVGEMVVARISAHQCTYGAGMTDAAFIYTHNIKSFDPD